MRLFDEDVPAVHVAVDKATSDAKEHGELEVNAKFRATAEPSGYCESVSFNCDHRDYKYIPGLYRGGTWGTLTPVFFRPEVLQKYGSDNRYKLEMPSRTSGIVLMPDDDQIGFGVNRRDEVIMWAGDVCSLTRREQLHLAAENIPSSHDVGSDFYDSQIEIEYPELSGPAKLFDVRARFNRAVQDKFKFKPTRLDSESSALISTFNPPIDRARQGVERAIHEMEKICVETINASNFLRDLIGHGAEEPDGGSLKVLEAWVGVVLERPDASNIACPFFVLNDVRQIPGHLIGQASTQKKIESACSRLGISKSSPLEQIFDTLVDQLISSYQTLTAVIEDIA